MSILVDKDTRVVFQGITGESGSLHARGCLAYGTQVVAGVTPGRGGQTFEGPAGTKNVPIYDTVEEAVRKEGAEVACIFVPPVGAADAICEAAAAGCRLVVAITEGTPVLDMIKARRFIESLQHAIGVERRHAGGDDNGDEDKEGQFRVMKPHAVLIQKLGQNGLSVLTES